MEKLKCQIFCTELESNRLLRRRIRHWPRVKVWPPGGRTIRKAKATLVECSSSAFSADGVDIGGFKMKVLELHPAKRVLWQVVDVPEEWIGTKVSWELK